MGEGQLVQLNQAFRLRGQPELQFREPWSGCRRVSGRAELVKKVVHLNLKGVLVLLQGVQVTVEKVVMTKVVLVFLLVILLLPEIRMAMERMVGMDGDRQGLAFLVEWEVFPVVSEGFLVVILMGKVDFLMASLVEDLLVEVGSRMVFLVALQVDLLEVEMVGRLLDHWGLEHLVSFQLGWEV